MSTNGEKKVAAAWDANAALWAREIRAGADWTHDLFNRPMFLEFLPDLKGRQVIDLGCGEGRNTREFARRGARMTGVDISAAMLDVALEQERRGPLGIRYEIASSAELANFPDASFDFAVSTMALMGTPDFPAVAHAAFRVLRRGGGLFFSVIHPCFATSGSHWERNATGQIVGRFVANYWLDQPYPERWGFENAPPFTIIYFPYRLEDYVNGLCEAGFRIAKMREPRPTEELASARPELQPQRVHAPFFLYVAALKD